MQIKKVTQKDRYGNTMSYEFEVPEKGIDQTKLMEKAMELGVPPMTDMSMDMEMSMGDPASHPGGPRGSDTVPAWLTPGEFVVNAEAMSIPGAEEQITQINNAGRAMQAAKGGMAIPQHYEGGGVVEWLRDNVGIGSKVTDQYGNPATEYNLGPLGIQIGEPRVPQWRKDLGAGNIDIPRTRLGRTGAMIEDAWNHFFPDKAPEEATPDELAILQQKMAELEAQTQAQAQGYQQGGKVAKAIGQLVNQQRKEVPFVAGPLLTDESVYARGGWGSSGDWDNLSWWTGGLLGDKKERGRSGPSNEELYEQAIKEARERAKRGGSPASTQSHSRSRPNYMSEAERQAIVNHANPEYQRQQRIHPDGYDPLTGKYVNTSPLWKAEGGQAIPIPYRQALLEAREGYRDDIYLDSLGKPTVGHGHLIEDAKWDPSDPRIGTTPYSKEQLNTMFQEDIAKAQAEARKNVGEDVYAGLNRRQQAALDSMAFQLGGAGQRKFKNMLAAIKAGDHDEAAKQALTGSKGGKSKWLKQTPTRAMDLAEAFSPSMAARYRAAGGAVYASDGGWGRWLKNKANKYVLGPNAQFDIPDPNADLSSGWTPPIANDSEYQQRLAQQIAMAENMVAGGDGDDLGTAPTAAMAPLEDPYAEVPMMDAPMPTPPAAMGMPDESSGEIPAAPEGGYGQAIADSLLGPEGREIIGMENEEDLAARGAEQEANRAAEQRGERVAWANPAYQAYLGRAESTGVIPDDYETWSKKQTSGAAEREAIFSNTPGATEQRATLAENRATAELDSEDVVANEAAMMAARASVEKGETVEEAAAAGKKAGDNAKDLPPVVKPEGETPETDPEVEGDGTTQADEALATANSEQRVAAQNEAKSLFSDLGLDSLFDKKELARMALMYAGSRLMGYSHSGSLQWAGKNYINRIDAKEQGFSKLALSGKYTPESLAKFKKTGNYADLMTPDVKPTITGNTMQRSVGGQKVVFQEVKVGDNVMYQAPDGSLRTAAQIEQDSNKYDPAFTIGTDEYRSRRSRATSDAAGRFKEVFDADDTIKNDKGSVVGHHTSIKPKQAADEFWAFMEDKGMDPESDAAYQVMTNAYRSAINDAKTEGRDVKPHSLKPYLEAEYIRQTTGAPEVFITNPEQTAKGAAPKYVNADKMQTLLGNFEMLGQKFGKSRDQVMQKLLADWQKMSAEEQSRYGGAAGESAFYNFAQQTMGTVFE